MLHQIYILLSQVLKRRKCTDIELSFTALRKYDYEVHLKWIIRTDSS